MPCVDESEAEVTIKQRQRSNSISSTVSNTSVLSNTKNEMLNIIKKLKTNKNSQSVIVGGPIYAGNRGPIKDI